MYGIAFALALVMFLVTVKSQSNVKMYRGSPAARLLDTVVAAVPAGSPTVMIFAVTATVVRLKLQGITVLYPGQLKMAADVDICCFDKTGTLTGSEVGAPALLPCSKCTMSSPGSMSVSSSAIPCLYQHGCMCCGWLYLGSGVSHA